MSETKAIYGPKPDQADAAARMRLVATGAAAFAKGVATHCPASSRLVHASTALERMAWAMAHYPEIDLAAVLRLSGPVAMTLQVPHHNQVLPQDVTLSLPRFVALEYKPGYVHMAYDRALSGSFFGTGFGPEGYWPREDVLPDGPLRSDWSARDRVRLRAIAPNVPTDIEAAMRVAAPRFEGLGLVYEPHWQQAPLAATKPDPLVVGVLSLGNEAVYFLLAEYDLTKAEHYVSREFASGGPAAGGSAAR